MQNNNFQKFTVKFNIYHIPRRGSHGRDPGLHDALEEDRRVLKSDEPEDQGQCYNSVYQQADDDRDHVETEHLGSLS